MNRNRQTADDDELYLSVGERHKRFLEVDQARFPCEPDRCLATALRRARPRITSNPWAARCKSRTRSSGVLRSRSTKSVRSIPYSRAASMRLPGDGWSSFSSARVIRLSSAGTCVMVLIVSFAFCLFQAVCAAVLVVSDFICLVTFSIFKSIHHRPKCTAVIVNGEIASLN